MTGCLRCSVYWPFQDDQQTLPELRPTFRGKQTVSRLRSPCTLSAVRFTVMQIRPHSSATPRFFLVAEWSMVFKHSPSKAVWLSRTSEKGYFVGEFVPRNPFASGNRGRSECQGLVLAALAKPGSVLFFAAGQVVVWIRKSGFCMSTTLEGHTRFNAK